MVRWFVIDIFFVLIRVFFSFRQRKRTSKKFETFYFYDSIVTIISNANFIVTSNYFLQWKAYLSEWHTQIIMKNVRSVCCVFCYAGDKRNSTYLQGIYCALFKSINSSKTIWNILRLKTEINNFNLKSKEAYRKSKWVNYINMYNCVRQLRAHWEFFAIALFELGKFYIVFICAQI